jgi:Mce-associated membrane protein
VSVSLYDLLDVDETASADEIKAAWKSAIADLDPTDRRFRAYNDAAAVLLDADKRATYDAELAAARVDEEPEETGAPADQPAAAPVAAPTPVVAETRPEPEPEPEPVAVAVELPPDLPEDGAATSRGVPSWALFVAAGLAVVSVVLMIVVLTWPGSVGGDSPASEQDNESTSEQAGRAAEDAAARAVPVVLSYDYRTLDQDFANAAKYLTDDFAQQRNALFAQKPDGGTTLRDQVIADKVVVTAIAPATGLTRVSADGERATVVVYVNQESQKGRSAARALQMWATLSMVKDGDDWLIDDICTESDCS